MPRSRPAAAGALAAGFALAVGWGAYRAEPRIAFAPFALADRVVRLTPGDVATYLIDHLGHGAQHLLVAACVGIVVGAGALAALLAARTSSPPAGAAGAFAAGVLFAGLLEPVQPTLWGVAASAAIAGASYGAALGALTTVAERLRRPLDEGRRRALRQLGGLAVGAAVLNALAPLIAARSGARLLELAAPARRRRAAFPRIAGLTPEVTSVADHYVVDIDISDPLIDVGSWRLRVDGLVRRPLDLGFDELQRRFDLVSEYAVLSCISNRVGGPLVGNSVWEGVHLGALLDAAGASADAWGLAVNCADGYSAGIPMEAAREEGSLVAIAQDGQPLARAHGFPCRLRIPALYGMLNPKWVTEIKVVRSSFLGYWARQGWSRTAVVRTESRIDVPDRARAGKTTWIAGVAWAGVRGIAAVEVSTDAGRRWRRAMLHEPLSPWAWTQWAYRWTPPRPGRYEVVCRAIDGKGELQDRRTRPPHPSGASGYPRRVVTAVA